MGRKDQLVGITLKFYTERGREDSGRGGIGGSPTHPISPPSHLPAHPKALIKGGGGATTDREGAVSAPKGKAAMAVSILPDREFTSMDSTGKWSLKLPSGDDGWQQFSCGLGNKAVG